MSAPKDDGGPAFPVFFENCLYQPGMSLRDYFGAAALTGLLADTRSSGPVEAYANDAYQLADAMLAERAKARGGAT